MRQMKKVSEASKDDRQRIEHTDIDTTTDIVWYGEHNDGKLYGPEKNLRRNEKRILTSRKEITSSLLET